MWNKPGLESNKILKAVSNGWTAKHPKPAQEFVAYWLKQLQAKGRILSIDANAVQFDMELSTVHLHGAQSVSCLLLSGQHNKALATKVLGFWQGVNDSKRRVFFLCLTPQADEAVKNAIPTKEVLRLSPQQIEIIMQSDESSQVLIENLTRQYSLAQLIPFNYTQPVESHMFFGRKTELKWLREKQKKSIAIIGPRRFGKTSLGKQFHHLLVAEDDKRATRKYYVDFKACVRRTSDAVARYLAINIDPSKRSDCVGTEELLDFLKYQKGKHHGPLELLIDELDEICHVQAFKVLAQAAQEGLCRLVLCGGEKVREALNRIPSKDWLEVIPLAPLDKNEARGFLIKPLTELGLMLEQPREIEDRVFRWTGCLPYLLQYYGKRLAAQAIEAGTKMILLKDVELISEEAETAQLFIEQFKDQLEQLPDDLTRRVAISLVTDKDHRRYFTAQMIQDLVDQYPQMVKLEEAQELCKILVKHHFLVSGKEAYRLANQKLSNYAHKMHLEERYGKIESPLFQVAS